MLFRIDSNYDLEKLLKRGFKKVIMNKKLYYIYNPTNLNYLTGNSIKVYGDKTIYDMDRQIGMDRVVEIEFIKGSNDSEKVLSLFYDLIKENIIKKEGV